MDKKNIGNLFDSIAGTYDRFNHLLSLNIDKSWRRRGVKRLRPADSVLDVATGTADLSIEAVRRGKACHVLGMDISKGMMEIGRQKVKKAGLEDRISFIEGSALEMPFDDAFFDAVMCAFGVRNFSDLDKGLEEMFRVLRPGGQLMILEFSYPSNPVIRFFYDFFFSHIMPLVGRLMSSNGGAFLYFRESVKNFIWGNEMCSRISSAGFSNVTFKPLTFGIATLYLADKA